MEKGKIYTLTGDEGSTSLVGGKRVSKTDTRLEAYGTVDELSAQLGLLIQEIKNNNVDSELLIFVQNKLFSIGAHLATDTHYTQLRDASHITDKEITKVEHRIDEIDNTLPPLTQFVLPGGHHTACQAHICRTVCRRAERRICDVAKNHTVDKNLLRFINRLSDYLFILARYCNMNNKIEEIFWNKTC